MDSKWELNILYEMIIDLSPMGIVVVDQKGIIRAFNPAMARMSSVDPQAALGRPISQVLPSCPLDPVLVAKNNYYRQKIAINDIVTCAHLIPIIKDDEIMGAIGFFQDVTEVEALSEELAKAKELTKELEAIIECCHDGIYVTDSQAITVRINSSYERITGIKREEVIGKRMEDLLQQGLFTHSTTLLVIKQKKPVSLVSKIRTGKEVLVTGTPVFDEQGNVVKVVNTIRDITELNLLKQQLEKERTLLNRYCSEVEELRARQLLESGEIIARSEEFKKVLDLALRVAKVDSTCLILGESGVGKEIIAKIIHKYSPRAKGPFIKINCGAIPETLLESELFGYEAGAFTGARKQGKLGLFEMANGGTLLLDEIAEMPLNLQVKLLRVLQEQELIRVGGSRPIKIDVRVIAATNKDLAQMVKEGSFRQDLYYRLNVVPIEIPPLRKRKEDIIPLALHFLEKFNRKYKVSKVLTPNVLEKFLHFDWPGNVRELENLIERLVVVSPGDVIDENLLPEAFFDTAEAEQPGIVITSIGPLKSVLKSVEKQLITKALMQFGSTRKAAKVLGVNQSTVARKARRYKINYPTDT